MFLVKGLAWDRLKKVLGGEFCFWHSFSIWIGCGRCGKEILFLIVFWKKDKVGKAVGEKDKRQKKSPGGKQAGADLPQGDQTAHFPYPRKK